MEPTGGRKWCTGLPQWVAKLTARDATKNWKQPEWRIRNAIKILGETRNSYRYDFKASIEMTVLTVTDIAIYTTLSNLDVKINNVI